jgi:gliding motility-associated lipoprotein GldD
MILNRTFVILLVVMMLLSSCLEEQTGMPKPRAYYRIDFPEKTYKTYEGACPYQFELPQYAVYEPDTNIGAEPCRANISMKRYRAKLHLTYKPLNNNLATYTEDARTLAYRHSVRASGIQEYQIDLPENKVYGMIYEIGGNAASSIQFYVSDSSRHFFRGSLYFAASPNADSLAPVVNYIRADIEHLLKTFRWKNP